MAKNDYSVIVCIVLSYMYKCLKQGEHVDVELMNPKALEIPDSYWTYIIRNLEADGYIEGVLFQKYKGGEVLQFEDCFNITPKGIEYLQENSFIKKAKETVKDFATLAATLAKMGFTIANF